MEWFFLRKSTKNLDGIIPLGCTPGSVLIPSFKSQELEIPVYSFPEFIFNQSQNKKRVVIVFPWEDLDNLHYLHVMKDQKVGFWLLGIELDRGIRFDGEKNYQMLPIIIIEGEWILELLRLVEGQNSFHYMHISHWFSGIAWDHYNVFSDFWGL